MNKNNKQKYDQVFIEIFSISKSVLGEDLIYNSIPEWDSVGHMRLIAGLEDKFEIVMEMDDIIDFSSYKHGFEILVKYDIQF